MRKRLLGRLTGGAWSLAWMWPLIPALISVFGGKLPHPALAGVGLAAFVVLYLILVTNGFDESRQPRDAVDIPLLAICGALGLTLLWAYGKYDSWATVTLYIAVTGVVVLSTVPAIGWVVGTAAVVLYYFILGPAHNASFYAWDSLLIGIPLAGALVFAQKRIVIYIDELRATRAKLAQTAVADERLRFSRDLHDLLGHTLSLIVVKAEVVRRLAETDGAAAAREAAEIEAIGRQALAEVRDAVAGYREPDFAVELDGCRSALIDAGMSVRVTKPDVALPPPANTLFGWAVREAATNAIRHSRARTCTIEVLTDGATATLDIADDGVGGRAEDGGGTGLLGLRERFAQAGGTVETSSQAGKGFRLTASVPIPAGGCS
jgi:two-component system sensor histidine kinase DesK